MRQADLATAPGHRAGRFHAATSNRNEGNQPRQDEISRFAAEMKGQQGRHRDLSPLSSRQRRDLKQAWQSSPAGKNFGSSG